MGKVLAAIVVVWGIGAATSSKCSSSDERRVAAYNEVVMARSASIGPKCVAAGNALRPEGKDAAPRVRFARVGTTWAPGFAETVLHCVIDQTPGLDVRLEDGPLADALNSLPSSTLDKVQTAWGRSLDELRELAQVERKEDFFAGVLGVAIRAQVADSLRTMLLSVATESPDTKVAQEAKDELSGRGRRFERFLNSMIEITTGRDMLLWTIGGAVVAEVVATASELGFVWGISKIESVWLKEAAVAARRIPAIGGEIAGMQKVTHEVGSMPRAIEILRSVGVAGTEVNQVTLSWTEHLVELKGNKMFAVPKTLATADKLAAEGDLASTTSQKEFASQYVAGAKRRYPVPVEKTVRQLGGKDVQRLPETRAPLNAVSDAGSPRAVKHVKTALSQKPPPADKQSTNSVKHARLIVRRDIEQQPPTKLSTTTPTKLSDHDVGLDTPLCVGREGLTADTGCLLVSWRQTPDVSIKAMKENPIGPLPNRIVTGTTRKTTEPVAPNAWKMAPAHALLFPKCDSDHKTVTTHDDC